MILPLSEGISESTVFEKLDAMSFESEGPQNIPEALQLASTEMFAGRTRGASKYILFGSGKVFSSPTVLEASAKPLVDQGVSLMPVAFSADSSSSLRSIASIPSDQFYFPAVVEELETTVGLASKVIRSGRVTN